MKSTIQRHGYRLESPANARSRGLQVEDQGAGLDDLRSQARTIGDENDEKTRRSSAGNSDSHGVVSIVMRVALVIIHRLGTIGTVHELSSCFGVPF